ncbi:HAMP domain-containing histidine kinase [Streptomyces formicae]|uniref:histidine kinase n=1 Tax=Streptomyces formicae TaxID=1616117 RepID=A0ABY3WUG7_9ACTN|nr:HAMP domain-containing sensor histidine kinase [Streptomyces formicae]UNM16276.1 HAMP domain-containing histidine kinase [Streptomyces formicae]
MRRPRRFTLRARLTLIYGGLFFVAGVVLLGVTYALFSQQLAQSEPKFLARIDGKAKGGLLPPITQDPKQDPKKDPQKAPKGKRQTIVISKGGDVLTGDDAVRWMENERNQLYDAATTSLLAQGGIALVIVGGAAAGFGWLVAGRVLAPLHRVTDTARRIADSRVADRGLHERIALRGPVDEVKDLADTFDTMVERLDRSFDGQRRFVANASHELRTPLTLGRALVEVAMHRRTASPDVKQLGENLLEINSRHERLINGLLLLADSENELTDRRPVDLADVVEHVVAQTAPEAKKSGIAVHDTAGEAPTTGDALLLERLVHNLVENGIRHNTGDGGWVRITSRTRDDDLVEIEVSNTGPVVPPYDIPALFEPFRRLGADRLVTAKGAGLGLSIVRSVTRAHAGEVTARPREGGGLVVTVSLPLSTLDRLLVPD